MGGGGVSGRVRALNLTVPFGSGRVGSDDLGYGPGSGFSFEPVQTSSVYLYMSMVWSIWRRWVGNADVKESTHVTSTSDGTPTTPVREAAIFSV